MGMTVVELNHYMETHPEIDTMIDDGIRALSDDERMLVIDSRMAWHFTKGTFKVYMTVDLETSALRIMNANRQGEHASTLEQTLKPTRARRLSEQKRNMEQDGVDIKDLMNYSLIVDTTEATPENVAEVIISSFKKWQEDKSFSLCCICPERLNYPDDAPDSERVAKLAEALDEGKDIPEITVFECDGEFYIDEGAESALAYAFNMCTHIPARLVRGSTEGHKYVKMKNSI
jgi:cytidylate kinase